MSEPLNIVCWLWDNGLHPKKRIKFSHEHVNTLYRMLERNLTIPWKMTCITDDRERDRGIYPFIKKIDLWPDYRALGGCFVRLKAFKKDIGELLGPRFISMDIDVVITGNLDEMFSRKEEILCWGEHWRKNPICGSFYMMDAGCRPEVWESFDPEQYPPRGNGASPYPLGTDQWRMNDVLYPTVHFLTSEDGIYNFGYDIRVIHGKPHKRKKVKKKQPPFIAEMAKEQMVRLLKPSELRKLEPPEHIHSEFRRKKWVRANMKTLREKLGLQGRVGAIKELDALSRGVDVPFHIITPLPPKPRPKPFKPRRPPAPPKGGDGKLPENAKIIFFNGRFDPSDLRLQEQYPWIAEYWR